MAIIISCIFIFQISGSCSDADQAGASTNWQHPMGEGVCLTPSYNSSYFWWFLDLYKIMFPILCLLTIWTCHLDNLGTFCRLIIICIQRIWWFCYCLQTCSVGTDHGYGYGNGYEAMGMGTGTGSRPWVLVQVRVWVWVRHVTKSWVRVRVWVRDHRYGYGYGYGTIGMGTMGTGIGTGPGCQVADERLWV